MSIQSKPYYWVICDWEGCGVSAQEDSDYTAWGDEGGAIEMAGEAGFWTATDDKRHYCPEHPKTWASDHENGEPYPDPPYLLIHDGDTDNGDDDGKVSLVAAPTASDRGSAEPFHLACGATLVALGALSLLEPRIVVGLFAAIGLYLLVALPVAVAIGRGMKEEGR